MNSQAANSFDAYYFAHGCGQPYRRDRHWLDVFGNIAERIVADIQPGTVLDAGCAMGFLVESLRDRGVSSFGIDISDYAIQQVREDVRPHCWIGSVTDPFPQKYDLIVCIEILEHLATEKSEQAVANLCQHTDDILFSSTPFDYKEASHFNVQCPEYWGALFAQQGFFRDVDFDASFITPWAARFRRKRDPLPRLVRDYERRFWLLWKENVDLRELVVEMRQQAADGEHAVEAAAELRADLDWMRARIRQLRRWNLLNEIAGAWSQLNFLRILDRRPVRRLPSLLKGPICQSFSAEHDNLNAVTVLLETEPHPTVFPLRITLSRSDTPDEPVVDQAISPRHLPGIGTLTMSFPPIPKSQSQLYRLTFHVPEGSAGDTLNLWGYVKPGRADGELRWRGQTLNSELVMSATYGLPPDTFNDRWQPSSWNLHSLANLGYVFDLALGILSRGQRP